MILTKNRLLSSLRKTTSIKTQDFVVTWSIERSLPPFIILLSIVLSQNTSDKNALVALNNLLSRKILEPRDVLELSEKDLTELIKPAGMYKARSKTIMSIAMHFKNNDELKKICGYDTEKARDILMSIKGIGVKTAEVFLSAYCGKNVFPVDRHILRITSRLLGKKVSYKIASEYWKKMFQPKDYREAHLRLIDIGRKICRPKKPLCNKCPLNNMCEYQKNIRRKKK